MSSALRWLVGHGLWELCVLQEHGWVEYPEGIRSSVRYLHLNSWVPAWVAVLKKVNCALMFLISAENKLRLMWTALNQTATLGILRARFYRAHPLTSTKPRNLRRRNVAEFLLLVCPGIWTGTESQVAEIASGKHWAALLGMGKRSKGEEIFFHEPCLLMTSLYPSQYLIMPHCLCGLAEGVLAWSSLLAVLREFCRWFPWDLVDARSGPSGQKWQS